MDDLNESGEGALGGDELINTHSGSLDVMPPEDLVR
jgi:hypothetical protein